MNTMIYHPAELRKRAPQIENVTQIIIRAIRGSLGLLAARRLIRTGNL
jgi:hypothetical protein